MKREFGIVPRLSPEDHISGPAHAVWGALCLFADWQFVQGKPLHSVPGTCFPSHQKLVEESGFSEKTVRRAIEELEAAGYVVIERRANTKGQTSNGYLLKSARLRDSERRKTASKVNASQAQETHEAHEAQEVGRETAEEPGGLDPKVLATIERCKALSKERQKNDKELAAEIARREEERAQREREEQEREKSRRGSASSTRMPGQEEPRQMGDIMANMGRMISAAASPEQAENYLEERALEMVRQFPAHTRVKESDSQVLKWLRRMRKQHPKIILYHEIREAGQWYQEQRSQGKMRGINNILGFLTNWFDKLD